MMNKEAVKIYSQRTDQFSEEQKKIEQQLSLTSFLRLVLFMLFAWLFFYAFKTRFEGHYLLYAILTLPGFLIFVFWAEALKKKNKFLQQLILINENEINITNNKPSFLDNGAVYAPDKGFTVDLNVFGNYSLFHLLNRTASVSGKHALSNRLQLPFSNKADIVNYQECAVELSAKINFRQTLLAHTLLLKEEESFAQLQSGLPGEAFAELKNKWWSALATVWPLIGVLLIIYSFISGNYQWMIAFGLAGLLLMSFIFRQTSHLYNHISKRSYLFNQYAQCFQLICSESFQHPYLSSKQKESADAAGAFKRLSKLVGLYDLRMSLLSFILNGLFLHELLCARSYMRWSKQYQSQIKNWFAAMGEMELLNSLATFQYNHTSFIFPECVEDKLLIKATAMGHPLMKEGTAVTNDIEIGENATLHLITGSNMSGKSTFLRTLGLNLILAQLGAPVFAQTFAFRPVRLLTSFHHIDSLEESTSYFYAELKCLQEIITSLSEPVPALVLLDEVMRGTNSTDKHDGTALLIKKILNYTCLALIATHDTELGVLAENHPVSIQNFCFESELSERGLTFDFKMRAGVAQSRNATYLMQKMGII